MTNYKMATEKATALLEKYDVQEPIIPVFDLAEREGVKVHIVNMPDELSDVSGFIDLDEKVIYVNSVDQPTQQMFTVAHELGHWSLHKDKKGELKVLLRYADPTNKNDPIEQEANCFASHLLVPLPMLKKAMKENQLTKNDSSILAGLFGVSNDVVKHQLTRV